MRPEFQGVSSGNKTCKFPFAEPAKQETENGSAEQHSDPLPRSRAACLLPGNCPKPTKKHKEDTVRVSGKPNAAPTYF